MYLLLITSGMCVAYFVLYVLFSYFFKNTITPLNRSSIFSIFYIVIINFLTYIAIVLIEDPTWANRILHIFGGGFIVFFICFLVVKNSKLSIKKFQFFIFSFLIVMALGVANEVIEFFLQNYLNFKFTHNVNDTWLDLISNIIGALIAAICFVPFIKPGNHLGSGDKSF